MQAYVEQAIVLMQERCTAPISATNTGKIDVRDWQLSPKTRNACWLCFIPASLHHLTGSYCFFMKYAR